MLSGRQCHPLAKLGTIALDTGELVNCGAKNKAGAPCGAPALDGSSLCVMHSGRAPEIGRKGGLARGFTPISNSDEKGFAPPNTAQELRDVLGQAMADVHSRRLDPKIATTPASVVSA
jgi:hypothetical protein